MENLAYLAAAFIGISLGLIGGGGSVLTVPVLVYLFGINPVLATSYSLFIVGATSMTGAIDQYRKGLVNVKTAVLFGSVSVVTVFVTRKFVLPVIPAHIASIGSYQLTLNTLTMILFAILMIMASLVMIRNKAQKGTEIKKGNNLLALLGYGVAIGLTTGFLGAGGGFLLIPTLVMLLGLPMKEAIGTSLLIIAFNSLIGFSGDLGNVQISWPLLLKVTLIAVAGLYAGIALGKKIHGQTLKKSFGWFILAMGTYIITKELFF